METEFDYANYAKNMRKDLSNSNIRMDDGELNHKYFIVKRNQYFCPEKQAQLLRGLEVFGVGEWTDIKYFEFNNKVNEFELELRTSVLLGVTNLQPYIGQRFTEEELQKEKEENIKKATQLKKLRNGLYKND